MLSCNLRIHNIKFLNSAEFKEYLLVVQVKNLLILKKVIEPLILFQNSLLVQMDSQAIALLINMMKKAILLALSILMVKKLLNISTMLGANIKHITQRLVIYLTFLVLRVILTLAILNNLLLLKTHLDIVHITTISKLVYIT